MGDADGHYQRDMSKTLTLYLTELLLWQVKHGKNPVLMRLTKALEEAGWGVGLASDAATQRLTSMARPGFALFYEDEPFHTRALTLRRSYLRPFLRIEASAKRWEWDVAKATFDPEVVNPKHAAQFGSFWRKKLGLKTERGEGFVYVPLQGKLTQKRSFQSASPLQMLETVVQNADGRRVIATLHPSETYTDTERARLSEMVKDGRIQISHRPMQVLLPRCDYVATQNSSVAVMGYFLSKPALLFGQIDFHHIAGSVPMQGLDAAYAKIDGPAPDYARYLYWFFQIQALSVWRSDFSERLATRLSDHGWPD